MSIRVIIVLFLLFVSSNIMAQYIHRSYHTSLTIPESDTLIFLGDSLFVDTLVMQDNSVLRFVNDSFVQINDSFLGANVVISHQVAME